VTSSSTVCNICQGSGWKSVNGGAAKSVTRCDCTIQSRSGRLLKQARIPARFAHCDFDNYHPELGGQGRETRERALAIAKSFVQKYPVENTGLIFLGSIGVGKTHLATATIRHLILEKGFYCVFYDYRELLKDLQTSYNPDVSITEIQILKPVLECQVLVLDELGAIKASSWAFDIINYIINSRYNEKRTTIFTTNFMDAPEGPAPSKSLLSTDREAAERAARKETLGDRIGDRMRSRLHEMCRPVAMQGEDMRSKLPKN
jgi:DNA replication protein DnaC